MPEQQRQQHRHDQVENDIIPENPIATQVNAERGLPEQDIGSFGPTSPRLAANRDRSLEAASAPMKSTPPMVRASPSVA